MAERDDATGSDEPAGAPEIDEERGADETTETDEATEANEATEADQTREGDASNGTSDGGTEPVQPSAAKSSLLWGVVGGLAFLVLIQGYELLTDEGVTLGVKFGVAVAVAVGGAVGTYLVRQRLAGREGAR